MRTLGIDLSADPKKTCACLISWHSGRAEVEEPVSGLGDEELVERMLEADWVGIDAPFGWPVEFLETVTGWAEKGTWTGVKRERLRYRETDRFVQRTARLPLSVSSDRIAVTAMRCASLLAELSKRGLGSEGRIDRVGDDGVVEVYPGAALVQWSDEATDLRFDPQGYKGKENAAKREVLLDSLAQGAPWLVLDGDTRALSINSDDALDALLSSLVARAAAKSKTLGPSVRKLALARIEGWIHLPEKGSLVGLNRD